jgi:hypothetical protein
MKHLISNAAYDALAKRTQTFNCLFNVVDRAFADFTFGYMRKRPRPAKNIVEVIAFSKEERAGYETHFKNIQCYLSAVVHAPSVPDVSSSGSGSVELDIALCAYAGDGLVFGYAPFALYTCPSQLGDKAIYVFLGDHGGVVFMLAPTEALRSLALRVVCERGMVIKFDDLCCWCGKDQERLKRCPCLEVTYCGPDCQVAHWRFHKTHCPCAKGSTRHP